MPRDKTGRRVSCGNAGAVESVESQKQASPSFHEPLGNLAKRRRDSHISTAPAARADGKVENQKQVSHFPTAPNVYGAQEQKPGRGRASPPARRRALRAAQESKSNCR
jgi:hypothetical protein